MTAPTRLLIADDSAFVRKVLREIITDQPDIELVGIARDGLEALEKIAALRPQVITLDLSMPHLDGLGVLRALDTLAGPRVVVVSTSDADSAAGVAALQEGAFDVVQKPTHLAHSDLYGLAGDLLAKIRLAAHTQRPVVAVAAPVMAPVKVLPRAWAAPEILVIGTSTGGPSALTYMLPRLPATLPVPVAVALHIPAGYTRALAQRLNAACAVNVVEAYDGLVVGPGDVVLARGGMHMTLERINGAVRVQTSLLPPRMHHPSVDLLFESAAEVFGPHVLAAVLTGMGDDGLVGSRAICRAGGTVVAEASSSCVVYGMPRCVHEAGLAVTEAPLENMAQTLVEQLL